MPARDAEAKPVAVDVRGAQARVSTRGLAAMLSVRVERDRPLSDFCRQLVAAPPAAVFEARVDLRGEALPDLCLAGAEQLAEQAGVAAGIVRVLGIELCHLKPVYGWPKSGR